MIDNPDGIYWMRIDTEDYGWRWGIVEIRGDLVAMWNGPMLKRHHCKPEWMGPRIAPPSESPIPRSLRKKPN